MSKKKTKPVESLEISDLEAHPVWEFAKSGACAVRPVKNVPVGCLAGRLVASQVRLANGSEVWALIGNVAPTDPRLTEHFLTLSILQAPIWFTLSRYHDLDYGENGPKALAAFLGLSVDEVFPISYDITPYVIGDRAALVGVIPEEPRERLSRDELIVIAVP